MTEASALLQALKIDLGISSNAFNDRLTAYLQSAQQAITREGVTLTDSAEDNMLTVQYAAWTWRHRDTGAGMPRMLRWALTNRICSEHMQGG
ncbi:MAG: hypothetical protein IKS25_04180 [Oscillospiraceae bacterium]|nr:hypothetical protein [Oscillospiraceae bacterium]